MEFTFEWDVGGKTTIYHGRGERKEEVSKEQFGWCTSYQFKEVAEQVRDAFYEAMKKISQDPDYSGDPQGLEGTLVIDLQAPFSEEFMKKHPETKGLGKSR